ncbi:MAG TPA: MBL fold metallo-hydrolase [Propionibacteriaceae bacterium]|nr:MBL fold metallo-hydrolase [Propionibacteriaceae bacterium]
MSEFALGPWRELRPGIYRAVAEPETVNVGLVVGTESALLVDTGSSPGQGRAIRESVAAVTDRPLVAVVVTHWHYDHAFGVAAFGDLDSVGHESVGGRLGSPEAAAEAARLGLAPDDLAAPSRELVVATAYDLGGRRVEVAHLGRGHTDGDLVVVVPDADVVFAGDLIESAGPPSFGPDSVPDEWAGTLDGLVGLMTERTIAVPGHGDPVDREFVFTARGEIAAQAAGQTPVVLPNRPPLPLA